MAPCRIEGEDKCPFSSPSVWQGGDCVSIPILIQHVVWQVTRVYIPCVSWYRWALAALMNDIYRQG